MKPTNLEDVVHYVATHENQFENQNLNDLHIEFPNDFLVIMDPNVLLACMRPKIIVITRDSTEFRIRRWFKNSTYADEKILTLIPPFLTI